MTDQNEVLEDLNSRLARVPHSQVELRPLRTRAGVKFRRVKIILYFEVRK